MYHSEHFYMLLKPEGTSSPASSIILSLFLLKYQIWTCANLNSLEANKLHHQRKYKYSLLNYAV